MYRTRTFIVVGGLACLSVGAPTASAQEASPEMIQRVVKMLGEADENNDGRITRQEYIQHRAATFARLDRNSDGGIDARDRPRLPLLARRFDGAFGQVQPVFDKNDDGRITRREWDTPDRDAFAMIDANGDGVIEQSEIPKPD